VAVVTTFSSFRSSELSGPSEVFFYLALDEKGTIMAFEAILVEIEKLHNVSSRLEGLAEHHPPITDALLRIAGNVRRTAALLAVVVAVKLHGADGNTSGPETPL
jgi:uncharacterized ferredoxin-like protein